MKKLSRRRFISGASATALAFGIPIGPVKVEAGLRLRGSSGQFVQRALQVNASDAGAGLVFTDDYPFIDIMRNHNGWITGGTPTEDPYLLFSNDNYPQRLCNGTTAWLIQTSAYLTNTAIGTCHVSGTTMTIDSLSSGTMAIGQTVAGPNITSGTVITGGGGTTWTVTPSQTAATAAFTVSEPWVLTWGGGITVSAVDGEPNPAAITAYTINSNRIEYTAIRSGGNFGDVLQFTLSISAMSSPLTSFKMFRKSQETLLNAGKITNPDWIAKYGIFERVRFMGWCRANGSNVYSWDQRTTPTQLNQGGRNVNVPNYLGQTSQTKNTYTPLNAPPGSPTVWTNGLFFQASILTPTTSATVQAITIGSSVTTIQANGHGFTTPGETIQFGQGDYGSVNFANLDRRTFPVATVIDANNFTINVNSTSWGSSATGISGNVGWALMVAPSGLSPKLVVNLTVDTWNLPQFNGTMFPGWSNNPLNGLVTFVYDSLFDVVVASPMVGKNYDCCWETLLQICSEAGVNPHITLPHTVTYSGSGNYCSQFGPLVSTWLTANPARYIGIELSNEVWNFGGGFYQTYYAQAAGVSLWPASGNAFGEWYGYTYYNVVTVLEVALSSQLGQVRRIFGCNSNENSTSFNNMRLQAPSASLPAFPISLADEICIAEYYQPNGVCTPLAADIYNYKAGVATSNPSLISAAFASMDDLFTVGASGTVTVASGGVMTVSVRTAGFFGNGQNIIGSGFSTGPNAAIIQINSQLTSTEPGGALGGMGTYQLNNSSFTIASPTSVVAPPFGATTYYQNVTLPFWQTTCAANSVRLILYEGGWGIYPFLWQQPTTYSGGSTFNPLTATDQNNLLFAYYSSSNFANNVLAPNLANFKSAGGKYPSQFNLVGPWSNEGMFGFINPNLYGPKIPAYDTFLAAA